MYFEVCMYLGCWRVYAGPVASSAIQYDGTALHCLLPLQHYDVASLCRNFVTTELVSL